MLSDKVAWNYNYEYDHQNNKKSKELEKITEKYVEPTTKHISHINKREQTEIAY